MKVLIDGFWWHEGPVSNRQVLQEQIAAWRRAFPYDELHITSRQAAHKDILRLIGEGVHVHVARVPQHGLHVMFELAMISRKIKPDVVFTQNFVPIRAFGKRAVFVHDLIFESNPEWFTRLERVYLSFVSKGIKRADAIFTSSRTEKDRIMKLHMNAKNVHAVGIGITSELATARPEPPTLGLAKYNYWLTVGRLNIRKNLAYSVKLALESGRITAEKPLVVVGESQGKDTGTKEFEEAINAGLVILAGTVSVEELAWLYANCSAFLFTTLDEGFGLPAVEAGHFRAPLLLSDIPVMREVSNGRAIYIPLDNQSIAARLAAGVNERDGTEPVDDGAVSFNWEESISLIRHQVHEGQEN